MGKLAYRELVFGSGDRRSRRLRQPHERTRAPTTRMQTNMLLLRVVRALRLGLTSRVPRSSPDPARGWTMEICRGSEDSSESSARASGDSENRNQASNLGLRFFPCTFADAPSPFSISPSQEVPKVHRAPYPQAPVPAFGSRDRAGLQDGPAFPVTRYLGASRGVRSVPRRALRRHQPVRNPCQTRDHHAQGHPARQAHSR